MKATGIFNGNARIQEYMKTLHSTSQVIANRNIEKEIELLEKKIDNERLFICKYKRNYRKLATEAYGRIKYYRRRLAALKGEQA
jgi:hypothetical protein